MLRERFAALLQSLGPFSSSTHFAVALSGGADSLALTLLMQEYVAQHGGHITALTVDHRLRKESTEEAQRVAAMMHDQGMAHHILTPAHDTSSNNLQEAARHWRYRALSDYCHAQGILHCLVAHNAGDNRETVAHNEARGDTVDGISGMRSSHTLHGIRFLRPLLITERAELEAFLRSKKMAWIDDPSNTNPAFARVRTRDRLRHAPEECAALDATLIAHRPLRTMRDDALALAAMQAVTIHPLGFAEMNLAHWRGLDEPLASQLVADCLTTIGGATSRPRGSDTRRLAHALRAPFTRRTLHQCELTLHGDHVRIARELARVAAPIALTGNGETCWDGRFIIRHAIPAGTCYTLAALGNHGRKQAIARWGAVGDVAPSTPALWHLDELLYVPHIEVPHRVAEQVVIRFCPPKPLAAAPFW